MSEQTLPLALAFPLRGSQLIEASAGTGKTFTISALYLRLILGHGGEASGFGRELLPPQILVVTFTETAGASGPLLGTKLLTQLRHQCIRSFNLVTEKPRSFSQARANAVAQLFGGRIGKGHNKNLRR